MNRRRIYRIVFLVVALLAIVYAALIYNNVFDYRSNLGLIRQSNSFLMDLEGLYSNLREAESAHRGYQLTLVPSFLTDFQKLRDDAFVRLNHLDSLTENEVEQQFLIDTLRAQVFRKYNIISEILKTAEEDTDFGRYELNLLKFEKDNMNVIRRLIDEIEKNENQLLLQRLERQQQTDRNVPLLMLIAVSVAILILIVSYLVTSNTLGKLVSAQKVLKESEEKYRSLFKRSIDGILLMNCHFDIVEMNPSLVALLGVDSDRRINLREVFIDEGSFDMFKDELAKVEMVAHFESKLNTTADAVTVSMSCLPVKDAEDQVVGYQGIIRDMTFLKKAEQKLVQSEKLAMTGLLARTIAHEVRNPLNNIQMANEQLMSTKVTDSDYQDTLKFCTEIFESNSIRINNIIKELLLSSRPKKSSTAKISIETILNESLAQIEDRIKLTQIKLNRPLLSKQSAIVNADKEQMKIALTNILINAVEAMEGKEDGMLTVLSGCENDSATIVIGDNGPGISSEIILKLFDPFYSTKNHGTGLGLTSTKSIINSHNGEIEVFSKIGEGTRFIITIPLV
ncbi:MAG: CHASE3 domain-containing protein [Cyclobacteriaceae bacterium]